MLLVAAPAFSAPKLSVISRLMSSYPHVALLRASVLTIVRSLGPACLTQRVRLDGGPPLRQGDHWATSLQAGPRVVWAPRSGGKTLRTPATPTVPGQWPQSRFQQGASARRLYPSGLLEA